jgi:hypothetical protein
MSLYVLKPGDTHPGTLSSGTSGGRLGDYLKLYGNDYVFGIFFGTL